MDAKSSLSSRDWHIPRPSLSSTTSGTSGSAAGSLSDTRSRGGSASSQGSASNHSTHSATSGSLLLSAAHLARMNGRSADQTSQGNNANTRLESYGRKSTLTNAIVSIPEESRDPADGFWHGVKRGSPSGADATSVASSTHFTVVNGFTKQCPNKEPKTCCCKHSHQITVLVISMTILFSACILAAICFVEMRMRKETGIYKYS